MRTETEGIVLRLTKAANGRRMVLLLSREYGKISAGTSISERGRNRSALAMRPFTHGRYEINKSRNTYHVNDAEVVRAYYGIGDDIDKYICASFVLEFAERMLPEDAPAPEMLRLLLEFYDLIEKRKKKYMTPVIAFQLKAIQVMGLAPEVARCVNCGSTEDLAHFTVRGGGLLCADCGIVVREGNDELIYDVGFDIIKVLRYFFGNSLKSIENMALEAEIQSKLQRILKEYRAFHLNIGRLLSEDFLRID